MGLDRLASEFKRILDAPSNDTNPYDTEAEVTRIDDSGKIAWVHIPGGYDETPVELTMNAEPQEKVKVRVSGGRAWITGNSTSPPTDDKKAIRAERRAVYAEVAAENAKNSADSAQSAAELAWARAIVADEAANMAQESADSAYKSAGTALDQLSIVEDVVGVLHLLETNGNYALTNDTEVQSDKWYFIKNITDYHLTTDPVILANKEYYSRSGSGTEADPYVYTKLNGPIVRYRGSSSSVDMFHVNLQVFYDKIQEDHDIWGDTPIQTMNITFVILSADLPQVRFQLLDPGTEPPAVISHTEIGLIESILPLYGITCDDYSAIHNSDTMVIMLNPSLYYEADDNTVSYSVVVNPSGNPSEQGWYELVDIKEAVQNYVTSHLALTERGLWLQTANDSTRVLLSSSEGIVLYDNTGEVAKYGQTSQIGRDSGFHMTADGQELGFYDGPTKVAYINNNQLYITKSVVLQQMDLGTPAPDGLGQWSWKVHPTSDGNNLNLKWIG